MERLEIFVDGPIPPASVTELIAAQRSETGVGGQSIFAGQVRDDEVDGKRVHAIDYTCYESMATDQIRAIQDSLREKYNLTSIKVIHSRGKVPVGQLCIVVFTSAKRRKAAIAACEEALEKIKAEVPIWGEEIFEDQSTKWKVNH
jgi:molybdopterin synthase catalytic subunit